MSATRWRVLCVPFSKPARRTAAANAFAAGHYCAANAHAVCPRVYVHAVLVCCAPPAATAQYLCCARLLLHFWWGKYSAGGQVSVAPPEKETTRERRHRLATACTRAPDSRPAAAPTAAHRLRDARCGCRPACALLLRTRRVARAAGKDSCLANTGRLRRGGDQDPPEPSKEDKLIAPPRRAAEAGALAAVSPRRPRPQSQPRPACHGLRRVGR